MPTVYLIDASPYIFRAYFSIPESLVGPAGEPVNAIYGYVLFLLRLLDTERPTHVGIAFDESLSRSFRNELYPGYKAGRALPPAELEAQLADCQAVTHAMGIAGWSSERYEADDIIATVAAPLVAAGHDVVVVTSDKDLAQLVGKQTTLLDFANGKRYGPKEVVDKMGVKPEQVAEYLGLAGDPVDDIPGVPGIGAKTAAALLQHFANLEELYADLDRVATLPLRGARSVRQKLADGRDLAFLSRLLATTSVEVPIHPTLVDLALRGADHALLTPLLTRWGFARLGERIAAHETRASLAAADSYGLF